MWSSVYIVYCGCDGFFQCTSAPFISTASASATTAPLATTGGVWNCTTPHSSSPSTAFPRSTSRRQFCRTWILCSRACRPRWTPFRRCVRVQQYPPWRTWPLCIRRSMRPTTHKFCRRLSSTTRPSATVAVLYLDERSVFSGFNVLSYFFFTVPD